MNLWFMIVKARFVKIQPVRKQKNLVLRERCNRGVQLFIVRELKNKDEAMRITLFVLGWIVMMSITLTVPARAFDPHFFETLYDIPVMEGLVEVEDRALTFDKPGGRISQAAALGEGMKKSDIMNFYDTTLSQMGWGKLSSGKYQRDGDKLLILFEENKNFPVIRFMLSPVEQ